MKLLIYISILVLLIDSIYLSSLNKYFKKVFKEIQGSPLKINYTGAALCYILIILSIYYFGFVKNFSHMDMFLLGFFIYGIYEFTNYATFNKWPVFMTITDTIWGGLLYLITFSILKKLNV